MTEKVIHLTQIKQFYVPFDTDSYLTLRSLGIPLTRIPLSLWPTLVPLLTKKGYRVKAHSFVKELFDPLLEKLGLAWIKKGQRKASISRTALRLDSNSPSDKDNFSKVETKLRAFFERWGFKVFFEFSEHRGKLRLTGSYKPTEVPVIPIKANALDAKPLILRLGFTRIRLHLGSKYLETIVETQSGPAWVGLHRTRCLYSEVEGLEALSALVSHVVSNLSRP